MENIIIVKKKRGRKPETDVHVLLEREKKRREYLTTYQRTKYQTNSDVRNKQIAKVLERYHKNRKFMEIVCL